jgi:hypothetical protein
MVNKFASLLALLVLFAGSLGSSSAQGISDISVQCLNDTSAIGEVLNDTLSELPSPVQECANIFQSGITSGSGILNCSIDASQYADEYQATCEDAGGKHFVGNFKLECVISDAFIPNGTGTEIAFSWDIQNDNACLGASCTDADYEVLMDAAFGDINTRLGQLGSCDYSFDPSDSTTGSTPPTTATPGSPTMVPASAAPGSPTMAPSKEAVDGQPPSSTNAPVSTPAPTSGVRKTTDMTTLLPVAIGVAARIMGIF